MYEESFLTHRDEMRVEARKRGFWKIRYGIEKWIDTGVVYTHKHTCVKEKRLFLKKEL
jgi:hypothetical protein